MKFSHNIKKIRKDNQLTQEDLAKFLNVSRKTISSWETERSFPDIETLNKLSHHFDIPIDQLIEKDLEHKHSMPQLFSNNFDASSLIPLCTIQFIFIIIGYFSLFKVFHFPVLTLLLLLITLITYHFTSHKLPFNTQRKWKRNSMIFLIIILLINSIIGISKLLYDMMAQDYSTYYIQGAILGEVLLVLLLSFSMYVLFDIRYLLCNKKRKL